MRYGILADVHGNLQALRAAVGELRRAGVDEWLCAGDIIGYGPQPNECVAEIADLGAHAVLGNHELMLLGRLSDERTGSLCRETTPWTHAAIGVDSRAYLDQLPQLVTLPGIVMTHAALDGPDRYVRQDRHGMEQLGLLERDHPGARLLIVGHTHRPWVCQQASGTLAPSTSGVAAIPAPGRFLLNPGSVGQSRHREMRPHARCMLLDTQRAEVRFFTASYDVAACRKALREHDLPYECIHQNGSLIPGSRSARRVLRRLSNASRTARGAG